jgi:hypothetical protein
MRLVARPIDAWPGELTTRRKEAQFTASWSQTVELLERDAKQLGADEVIVQLAVNERDLRNDGWIRASARPEHPGVIVSLDSRHGPLRYSTDLFDGASYSIRMGSPGNFSWRTEYVPGWQCNLRAVALGLEALRKVDRYGIGRGGEQYRGWQALPPGTPMPPAKMTADEAARLLAEYAGGYRPGDVLEDPTGAWRTAARIAHPDAGGDPDLFRRLTEARDLLASGT